MNLNGFPIDDDLSSDRSGDPKDRHCKFGAPSTNQTCQAENLALANMQADRVTGEKRRDDLPKFDPLFRVAQARFGLLEIDVSAHHEPDHVVMIDFRLWELARVLSIPQTYDAISAGIDFHQSMGNIDNAHPGAL